MKNVLKTTVVFTCALTLGACSSGGSSGSGRADSGTRAEPSGTLSRGGSSRVAKAAEIAKAVDANPGRADEILREHGMTLEQYDDLMYDIAADPAMSAEFEARMSR
ncbi:MAG TPA: hypothetical protein VD997_03930 [Phycisphaerales bacterium]|nr:hypothetical protein [Phycisphaerales bacterium]